MRSPLPRRAMLLLGGCLLMARTPLFANAMPTPFQIEPGPRVMSPEEKGLIPDGHPGSGAGIILLEETDRNETSGVKSQVAYHLRAKIFSQEGAKLGTVRIHLDETWGRLRKWWGWTLLPDGSAREMKKNALREENPSLGTDKPGTKVLEGQIPVVPGCVIDYGYTADVRHVPELRTVDLRRDVPLRELRYRWTPEVRYSGDYRLPREEGLEVSAVREGRSVLITAKNLPAIVKEPWPGPEEAVRGTVRLYYHDAAANEGNFWRSVALRVTRAAANFSQDGPIRQAIASMGLPATSDLRTRLKLAYDWVAGHVRNVEMLPPVGISEPTVLGDMADGLQAQEILGRGAGDCRYLTFLYWGIARALGAEAGFVPVTDRRQRVFDAGLLSLSQFSRYLLAVGSPGDPKDALTLLDVCSGLSFGEVPWWLTGYESLLLDRDSAGEFVLHPDSGGENISETEARIRFQEDSGEGVHWTRALRRQQGLAERLRLRKSGPGARKEIIADLCGTGGTFQVSRAEESGTGAPNGFLRLECEAGLQGASPDSTIGTFRARFMGPWVPPDPEFPSPGRVNPVVFDFPRVDQVGIDVSAPPGFVPSAVPPPVRLETPYGQYTLLMTAKPDGYRVERVFFLSPKAPVPVSQYGALRAFLSEVARADQTPLEFTRAVPGTASSPGS